MDLHYRSMGNALILSIGILVFSIYTGPYLTFLELKIDVEDTARPTDELSLELNEKLSSIFHTYVELPSVNLDQDISYFQFGIQVLGSQDEVVYLNDSRVQTGGNWTFNAASSNGPLVIEIMFENPNDVLQDLHTSLLSDVNTIGNYAKMEGDYIENRTLLLGGQNVPLWTIQHSYVDGTGIWFEVFDDVVIVTYLVISHIRIASNGYAITVDPNSFSGWYGTIGSNPFGNYSNSVNNLLNELSG